MKSLYIIFILSFFSLLSIRALADESEQKNRTDANIMGHVEDAVTKEHMPYITVMVKGTTIGTTTDGTGHYFLKNLPVGEIVLVATFMGYKTVEIPVTTKRNQTLEINFLMEEQAVAMDEVVVTANRNQTLKKEAPVIVNVISPKLFENTASCNLTETMNFQSGLRVENSCSNCGSTQLRINGLEGQYSQILLDSRPVYSSLAAVYGLEQLPVSMVERVEVTRGGGSALFGPSAIGGVVNIITKEPLRNSVNLSNTTNLIAGKKTDINTSFNGSFVSDDYRTGMYLFGMVRDRQHYDHNGDGFSDVPKINATTAGFRGYYKLNNHSKLTAEYHHMKEFRRGGNNFDRPPHFSDIAEQLDHNIHGGGVTYNYFTEKHRVSVYASAQKINRKSYFGTKNNPDAYGTTKDETVVTGGQYALSSDHFLFSPSDLTVGIEFSHNNLHDRILGYNRNFNQISNIVGGFFQNEWKSAKFSLLLGARIDKHNLMKNAVFSPRANIRYSPSDKLGFRASYSSGYRAPQAYDEDLHVDAVGGEVSLIEMDPDLKPEYSHSISASADWYHSFGRWQVNFLLEGFYTYLDDVFALAPIGEDEFGNSLFQRQNASGATVSGINFEAKTGLPGKVEVQLGYTYQQSKYKDPFTWSEDPEVTPQRKMFRAPDHYGYLTANYTFTPAFKASLFGNYTGPMLVQHYAGYIEADIEKKTPDFFDLGVRLSYRFKLSDFVNFELEGGVKNVLDQFQKDIDKGVEKDAGYVYGPVFPRTYFAGVKFFI